MGWFEILLLLVFVVVPLLEQLAAARRKKQNPPPDEAPTTYEGGYEWQPLPRQRGEPAAEPGGGWSEGWRQWPGMEVPGRAEPEPAEVATLERDETPPVWSREWEEPEPPLVRPLPTPEQIAAARPLPVALPAAVEVDRSREHRRFHDLYVRREPSRPATVQRARPTVLAEALRQPGDLRRAIILTEVLGAPRALRPLDEPLH